MSSTDSTPATRGPRTAGIVGACVAIAIVAIGLTQRARSSSALQDWTAANVIPSVIVAEPQPLGDASGLQLPGRLEAYYNAPIYARANGYLKKWYVDIGAPVKAGQLLAEIETPDLDQELAQMRANLVRAEADAKLAESTAKRWQAMLGTDAVSTQEVDEKAGDYAAKKAAALAARAAVDALVATQNFRRIVAPFDGVVTSRSTDLGALISSGASNGPALFTVADTRKLRVYVQVPQSFMPAIKIGGQAELGLPEYPGRTFTATVQNLAGSVNARSGGSLVQLVVDNADGTLPAGGYADVKLLIPPGAGSLSIPASSLIFSRDGLRVAVLGDNNTVTMKDIAISRDLGKTVEVSGLDAKDRIIDSPPESLMAGDKVQLAAEKGHDAKKS
ncbi:MAG: efflux RND transporter periplasmic adaptor subunit [Ferrovibrio sp.]|uniref:efflux RND transporter periplasmic adaptor subunit n=1 Tax=Ferrovibrio sp. TaxID=1917215 RepID=UPI0026046231|nr:efflux RND transporter periplasmic adaptor subunit [Ferrovibrio sp.]MCW0235769.1 efflux RND transporter periplasmic adaptor subunit [Ferrovibrio sp.]